MVLPRSRSAVHTTGCSAGRLHQQSQVAGGPDSAGRDTHRISPSSRAQPAKLGPARANEGSGWSKFQMGESLTLPICKTGCLPTVPPTLQFPGTRSPVLALHLRDGAYSSGFTQSRAGRALPILQSPIPDSCRLPRGHP